MLLKVWSPRQQYQHHLRTCQKSKFFDLLPDLLTQKPQSWAQQSEQVLQIILMILNSRTTFINCVGICLVIPLCVYNYVKNITWEQKGFTYIITVLELRGWNNPRGRSLMAVKCNIDSILISRKETKILTCSTRPIKITSDSKGILSTPVSLFYLDRKRSVNSFPR